MRRAAIVSPLRKPIGAHGGMLRPVPMEELGATVARSIAMCIGGGQGIAAIFERE